MYLIKDIRGNYFDAEKVNSFEVWKNGIRFGVVAVIICGVDAIEKYVISLHDAECEAREHLDALINTVNGMLRTRR